MLCVTRHEAYSILGALCFCCVELHTDRESMPGCQSRALGFERRGERVSLLVVNETARHLHRLLGSCGILTLGIKSKRRVDLGIHTLLTLG
ncbi:hypothetical protein LZ31DRAFT_142039 [Colletotrichum somersetense]|nr:hypothetical protein LZ31DRAFT_142039 [Colletotrichum somersetense]